MVAVHARCRRHRHGKPGRVGFPTAEAEPTTTGTSGSNWPGCKSKGQRLHRKATPCDAGGGEDHGPRRCAQAAMKSSPAPAVTAGGAQCKLGGNRDHVAGVNLAKHALLGLGKLFGNSVRIRRSGCRHAPMRQCRDKSSPIPSSPTPSRPRHRCVRRSVPAAKPPLG